MGKRTDRTEFLESDRKFDAGLRELERKLKALGDTLRRAAKNADALDLKPEAKAWLLDQFGPDKPGMKKPPTDTELDYARDIVRQQLELEQQAKSTSGKKHLDTQQGRRKSGQDGGDLPSH